MSARAEVSNLATCILSCYLYVQHLICHAEFIEVLYSKRHLFRWLEGSAAWAHWPGNCLAMALIGDSQHGIYEGVLESS